MVAPKLKIIRVPLSKPIPDIKPAFGELGDLHLELLENKLKLKKGLPLIPIRNSLKPKPRPRDTTPSKDKSPSASPVPQEQKHKPQPKSVNKVDKRPKKNIDDELVNALGASEGEKESEKKDEHVSPPPKAAGEARPSRNPESRNTSPKHAEKSPKPGEEKIEIEFEDDPLGQVKTDEPVKIEDEIAISETVPEETEEPKDEETPPVETEPEKSPEEIEEEERQEYVVKLRILKKQYPKYEFPPYSPDHTDRNTLKRIYNQAYRELTLDENVERYEMFLSAAFVGIGMLGVKLNLPFEDFAKIQMKKMKKYRRMLFELGEKSYVNFMESWPVEVRLLGMVIMDAGLFWLGKVGLDFLGGGAGDLLSMLTGTQKDDSEKKPRMRGPKTTTTDIKNMASKDD